MKAHIATDIPFDADRLDSLMEQFRLDAIVVTSKHNVQYLLGGYRFFFFETGDAIGVSRYLPALVYVKGRPQDALYVGNAMEYVAHERGEFWTPHVVVGPWQTNDTMAAVVEHLKALAVPVKAVGIEAGFMPADAKDYLVAHMDHVKLSDAHRPLERLRSIKRPEELALIKIASEGVVESMCAAFSQSQVGDSKFNMIAKLRLEQVKRGLDFNFCQISMGATFDRVPSTQRLCDGDVVSLDSGGSYKGYVGDLCRMGFVGEPDAELQDVLAEIDRIQQTARGEISPGTLGKALIIAGDRAVGASWLKAHIEFTVHGLGLVNHELPRLTRGRPLPYVPDDADVALEEGMVLSVETTLRHPSRGFIKLEDTLAVTKTGSEGYGDEGRRWNAIARSA